LPRDPLSCGKLIARGEDRDDQAGPLDFVRKAAGLSERVMQQGKK